MHQAGNAEGSSAHKADDDGDNCQDPNNNAPLDAGSRFLGIAAGADTLNACNELNDRGHSDNDGTGIEQPDALRTARQRRQSADAENGKYTCDHTNHAADDHEDGCYLQNLLTFHL